MTEAKELVEQLKTMYAGTSAEFRILPDGSVAILHNLLTTRSIVLGADEFSWKRRFCFKDHKLAKQRFDELKSEKDIPAGYVARRPEIEDRADPYLNKLYNRTWNKEFERG